MIPLSDRIERVRQDCQDPNVDPAPLRAARSFRGLLSAPAPKAR